MADDFYRKLAKQLGINYTNINHFKTIIKPKIENNESLIEKNKSLIEKLDLPPTIEPARDFLEQPSHYLFFGKWGSYDSVNPKKD